MIKNKLFAKVSFKMIPNLLNGVDVSSYDEDETIKFLTNSINQISEFVDKKVSISSLKFSKTNYIDLHIVGKKHNIYIHYL